MKSNSKSEGTYIERSRVALTNAKQHPEIKAALAEYNYADEKLDEGWVVFNNTVAEWERSKQERRESEVAGMAYRNQYDEFVAAFKSDRDKTRILFKKSPETLVKLGVTGAFPTKTPDFFNKTQVYYNTIKTDTDIQSKMALLKITPEVADNRLLQRESVIAKYAEYVKENGQSQDSYLYKKSSND